MRLIVAKDVIAIFRQAYLDNYGYIYGMKHELWSEAKQKDYVAKNSGNPDKAMSCKVGGKWAGHWVTDCSGLFSWAFKKLGGYMPHGSNSMWRDYCTAKGDMSGGKRTDGQPMKPGTAVFTDHSGDKTHVGLFIGNGEVIEAAGASDGVIVSKVTNKKWKCWGELKGMSFSDEPEKNEVVISLEQAKVTGGSLRLRMTPSTAGTVITTIPDGAIVDVLNKANDMWWSVSYKGRTGYVMKSFLTGYTADEPKTGNTNIVLPTDTATELYNALKKALNK